MGRAFPNRSGFGKDSTKYTKDGPGTKEGTKGGSSWTPDWLKFDNSYFKHAKEQHDSDLLVLETDDVLFKDDGFRCGNSPLPVVRLQCRVCVHKVQIGRVVPAALSSGMCLDPRPCSRRLLL